MKLLALLIILALRRVEWRHDPQVARRHLDDVLLAPLPLAAAFARSPGGRLLVLGLFWAVIGFTVRFGIGDALLSLPLFCIYALLLWVLLGHDLLGPDVNEYLRRWHLGQEYRDGHEGLQDFARERFGVAGEQGSAVAVHRAVLRALFVRAYREKFAWIVVFALIGLPGLLLLATIDAARGDRARQRDSLLQQAAVEMGERMDWLVSRLFALSLLLTGNSTRAWPLLDNRLLDDDNPSEELLATVSVAAAGFSSGEAAEPDVAMDVTDARGLLLRTQVLWVLLMALSVIVGF